MIAARFVGDATGVQVPRHVGLVHGEDVLDEAAKFPSGGRQLEGPLRRRVARNGQQLGQGARRQQQCHSEQFRQQLGTSSSRGLGQEAPLQLPVEALQSGAQATGAEGLGLSGTVAAVLREKSKARYIGYTREAVQRHQHRRGRLRLDVLRPGLQDAKSLSSRGARARSTGVAKLSVNFAGQKRPYTRVYETTDGSNCPISCTLAAVVVEPLMVYFSLLFFFHSFQL